MTGIGRYDNIKVSKTSSCLLLHLCNPHTGEDRMYKETFDAAGSAVEMKSGFLKKNPVGYFKWLWQRGPISALTICRSIRSRPAGGGAGDEACHGRGFRYCAVSGRDGGRGAVYRQQHGHGSRHLEEKGHSVQGCEAVDHLLDRQSGQVLSCLRFCIISQG